MQRNTLPATFVGRDERETDYLIPAWLKAQRPTAFNPDKTDKLVENRQKVKILIVDDNALLQELLEVAFSELLGHHNCKIWLAYNGQMGLRLMLQERPDIVVFDLHMPLMNGLEMLKRLRESEAWVEGYHPHLIALTGQINADSIEKAMALGVDHYFTKPFSTQAILERVRGFVQTKE
jgi:CheY-like chemotaxis protein